MNYQVYDQGDFWYAIRTALPGESPQQRPDLWRRIEIPEVFAQVLTMMMLARLQESEGQFDKARAIDRRASLALDELLVTANMRSGRPRQAQAAYVY